MNEQEYKNDNKYYYTDSQIVGNLTNHYIQYKNYDELKSLCSSIQNQNHLKDDYRKIISHLENNKQLSDYLYKFHPQSFNFNHFKNEFKKINNLQTDNSIIKIFNQSEIINSINEENFRLFVKIIGNTKQLSSILNVKKMQIMWIANTPVWFVPYENLRTVLNTARINNIEIKVEKLDDNIIFD